jgi:cyclic dehypoxanthinyl futalosine synthase
MALSIQSPTSAFMKNNIEKAVLTAQRLSPEQGRWLLECEDLHWLAALADEARCRKNPEAKVTYVVDRNINYSNICNTCCKFCAFYRLPGKEGGYILSNEEIGIKIDEAKKLGGTSILLQGGHHPDLDIGYYEELFSFISQHHPIHLHALSPPEIWHIARISKISLPETLQRLNDAGLKSIPGGGAEILTPGVRNSISPRKGTPEDWLEVMRQAHLLGIPSSATMMFGHQETLDDRIEHLDSLRQLQDETGGFTAFIPWTFQPGNTEMDEPKYHFHNLGVVDYLRTLAVSRLMLDNFNSIQASWVTQGAKIAQIALSFGANDFGSTMLEENVVKAAGVSFSLDEKDIVRLIREAGYAARRRTILYEDLGEPYFEAKEA